MTAEQRRLEGTAPSAALSVVSRMEREGTLDELADLLSLVQMAKKALTDQMVVSMVRRVEGLAAAATDPALTGLVNRLPGALRAAEAEAARAAPAGLVGLLRQLRDPQVQRGLTFVLALAKHLAPAESGHAGDGAAGVN